MGNMITVNIADMQIGKQNDVLITYALGSCVGISLYDPALKLAALLHIMLPSALKVNEQQVYKFADTGIRKMILEMNQKGGIRSRYVCKIAGGAKMFNTFENSSLGNIGQRNIEAVKSILNLEHIPIVGQEVGGGIARTMSIEVATGRVSIRTIGHTDVWI